MRKSLSIAAIVCLLAGAIQAQDVCISTNTPLPVPATGTSGTTNDSLSGCTSNGVIEDVDVFVDITHTFNGDLEIYITNQCSGTEILLRDNVGGSGDDVMETYDDDGGGTTPTQALSGFDGEDCCDGWSIRIEDLFGGDSGTLRAWGVVVTCARGAGDSTIECKLMDIKCRGGSGSGSSSSSGSSGSGGCRLKGVPTRWFISTSCGGQLETVGDTVADLIAAADCSGCDTAAATVGLADGDAAAAAGDACGALSAWICAFHAIDCN